MFFIGKNTVVAVGILCLCSSASIAQENPPQKNNTIVAYQSLVIEDDIVHLSIFDSNTIQAIVSTEDTNAINYIDDIHEVCSHHWDNKAFDPYLDGGSYTNFEVTFKEEHFSPPVQHEMYVTSHYGWRNGRAHKGIDIDLETGDIVNTILDGKVRYVGNRGGYGKIVIVRHYNGLETLYAHLSDYLVEENEIVMKGQPIGKGGVTGNARGSHLHMEIRYHGKSIHPEYLLDFENGAKIRCEKSIVTKKWMTPSKHTSKRKSKIKVLKVFSEEKNTARVFKDPGADDIYVVKKGDTLYAIAHRYNMDVGDLCHKNEISHTATLNIGQKILVN